jgi:hypothetical protein
LTFVDVIVADVAAEPERHSFGDGYRGSIAISVIVVDVAVEPEPVNWTMPSFEVMTVLPLLPLLVGVTAMPGTLTVVCPSGGADPPLSRLLVKLKKTFIFTNN